MKVVGFAGMSGSGKTTLVERLIPLLSAGGRQVSVVKHAHHKFDIDYPGKDTFRHREAGAFEVVVASNRRLALMREFARPTELDVHALIAELDPKVDWVLVEGFKKSTLPKIEVWRAASGKPPLYPADPMILAVATDSADALPEPPARDILDLNDAERIAGWLTNHRDRLDYR
ncbi:MAG: molybdopterin-guanine dinucleotide biosynthesis protein B [Burkholderiales bacterium]